MYMAKSLCNFAQALSQYFTFRRRYGRGALGRHPDAVQRRAVPSEHGFDGAGGFLYASAAQRHLRPWLRMRELQEEAAALAQENAVQNGLSDRLRILCGDLREHRTLLPHSSFDAVVSNPPYYPAGSGSVSDSPALAAARTELFCTLDDLCACAAWLLRSGGRFFVVHKPERLAELICALSRRRLEPKRLRLVRHQAGGPVSLVLLEARLDGRPGLQFDPDLCLYDASGAESADFRRIYHHQEA